METPQKPNKANPEEVLIVPCGMETNMLLDDGAWDDNVLIVPCGMETKIYISRVRVHRSINCTLRNGNFLAT